jgi:hypothetical protein
MQLYTILFVIALAGIFWGDYKYTQSQNAKLKSSLSVEVEKNERLHAQKEAQEILTDANNKAALILNNSQIQSQIDKNRRVDKANEINISETAKRDADKYTAFTERVMEKNFQIIQCKSDYRKIHDEENPCIGHVR